MLEEVVSRGQVQPDLKRQRAEEEQRRQPGQKQRDEEEDLQQDRKTDSATASVVLLRQPDAQRMSPLERVAEGVALQRIPVQPSSPL